MRYLISEFSKFKSVNESELPGRTKQTAGMGQRVVGVPIDKESFKIKIIRDLDVIDQAGKLTQSGWDGILAWIKQQHKWLPAYPGLGDLNANFVVYSVNTDNDRKQSITFTIQPRSSAPGLDANVKIIKKEDLAAALSDKEKASELLAKSQKASTTIIDTTPEPAQTAAPEATSGKSVALSALGTVGSDSEIFKIFDDAVASMATSGLFTEKEAVSLINKTADELEAKNLGTNSAIMMKALMKGFGMSEFTDKYGRKKEQSQITPEFLAKLKLFTPTAQNSARQYFLGITGKELFEQVKLTALPEGFDMTAFMKAISSNEEAAVSNEGVLKQSEAASNPELVKKVQTLIIEKLGAILAKEPTFIKFKGFGADGKYGPTTRLMIAAVKTGFGFSDVSGTTITPDLVAALESEERLSKFKADDAKKVLTNGGGTQHKNPPNPKTTITTEVQSAIANKTAMSAFTKFMKAISGDFEDEEAIVELFRTDLANKSDFDAMANLWKHARIDIRKIRTTKPIIDANAQKIIANLDPRFKKNLDPNNPLRTLKSTLEFYMNNDERAAINAVLPVGVDKLTIKDQVSAKPRFKQI